MVYTATMKQIFRLGLGLISVLAWTEQSPAASFTGTPSPSLSPVFGTLVDFDDQPTETPVLPTDYVSVGVASIEETEDLGVFARYLSSQSQPNYIGTGFDGERGNDTNLGWDGTILIELTQLARKVGIGVADSDGGPEVLSIYDSGFNLLETATVSTENTYAGFTRDNFDIKYFSIKGDFFAVDDLQFASVPEPSSVSGVLALGAFGTGLMIKRSRRKKVVG